MIETILKTIVIALFTVLLIVLLVKSIKRHVRMKLQRTADRIIINGILEDIIISFLGWFGRSEFRAPNLMSFSIFKEDAFEFLQDQLSFAYLKQNFIDYGYADTTIYDNQYFKELNIETFNECVAELFKTSDKIDTLLATIFANQLMRNFHEIEENEKEAVEYHKSFGEEPSGDPVLHPVEAKNSAIKDEELQDASLDELASTGTVEEISE